MKTGEGNGKPRRKVRERERGERGKTGGEREGGVLSRCLEKRAIEHSIVGLPAAAS